MTVPNSVSVQVFSLILMAVVFAFAMADFTQAIGTGTGILLTVMIIHNFYEIIAARYAEELHPSLRGFFQ